MADERPTHPTCVEAGRQGVLQESRGTKRDRAAPIAPADYLAPASSYGPEQVRLTDMVALADIEHDETVAALYDIVGPVQPQDAGSTSADSYRASSSSAAAAAEPSAAAAASRASSTLAAPRVAACGSPARVPHCGGMPVQADQEMHAVAPVKVELVPSCSSTFLPPLSGFSGDATDLPFLFARIFIPRHPNALPRSEWLSYPRLFSIVQLYAPARVWKQGRGNLKSFVIEWCKCLPTYAGLEQSKWCMRLKTNDRVVPGQKKPSLVYKFCLECALSADV